MNKRILRISTFIEARRIGIRSMFTADAQIDDVLRVCGYTSVGRARYTDGNYIVDIKHADHTRFQISVMPIWHIDPDQSPTPT